MSEPSYSLVAAGARTGPPPTLDEHQRRVVDHDSGPLLVLAGPGTGKTTTLVEAVVDRVEGRGVDPDRILALTFSRKAAEQLRDRVTARLGRTTSARMSSTFHSFAYGLVRRYVPGELYDAPLRLLSSPEQDVLVAELLGDEPGLWPERLGRAVGTRGFAREVSSVLARARERGLDPVDLVELGRESDDPVWVASGRFLQRYLVILDDLAAIDYPDLIRRAAALAEAHREELPAMYDHVFVDEYQDTDPSQVALLQSLAGDGRNLVAVGDPHQSIYGFRGADVRAILDFPDQFRGPGGERAGVVVLPTTRRFGLRLLTAAQRVAARLPLAGAIPADVQRAFLHPQAAEGSPPGKAEVLSFDTERAEAEHIADRLRRAHLEDGVEWSDMAVLVRSGRTTIPGLRRSLAAAGVPVEVASDETALADEPAVDPLLRALDLTVHLEEEPGHPAYPTATDAHALLVSPLCGLDATDVRAAGRALRTHDRAASRAEGRAVRSSAELLRAALLDPASVSGAASGATEGAARALRRIDALARLLRTARARLDAGASAEEVLWALWSGSDWPRRLRESATRGGPGSRLAHRDLDALCALFETAQRAEENQAHTSVASFAETLRAQEIPADTMAEHGVRGSAVRLLTAHRAKGLEWRYVVVAHVQEESWPDLARRTTLLQADRIGPEGLREPLSSRAMLAEERRLFYVATTRARERLVVTAVASGEDDGEQPSRFLPELGVGVVHVPGRPRRPLSLAGMVAELRRTLADESEPDVIRDAAARRLALLAALRTVGPGHEGRALVPGADPGTWWGTRALTRSERPVRPTEEPVRLSGTALESLSRCSLRWFLEREAGGASLTGSRASFGSLVHLVAEHIAAGDLPSGERDIDELVARVDSVWEEMAFATPWSSQREREQFRLALLRLVRWLAEDRGREFVASEQDLVGEWTLPSGHVVRLRGRADRLERDGEGRAVVVDFKTGKHAVTGNELREHQQLAVYQLLVAAGAADEALGGPARLGGAELVQLRAASADRAKVQAADRLDLEGPRPLWVEERLEEAVRVIRDEAFSATPGSHCRYCDFHQVCPAQTGQTVIS